MFKNLFLIGVLLIFLGCNLTNLNTKEDFSNEVPPEFNTHFLNPPKIKQFKDKHWVLQENFILYIGLNDSDTGQQPSIEVPAGFVTDLASIPPPADLILDDWHRYASAAIVHDYMYWVQPCGKPGKRIADKIFKQSLKATKNSKIKAYLMKLFVSSNFGRKAWKSNLEKRNQGESRFIPEKLWPQIGDYNWKDFALKFPLKQLASEKVHRENDLNSLKICKIFPKFND